MKEKLVEEAVKLNEELDNIRGYESGITKKMLEMLSEETLKDCNEKTKKQIERLKRR